MRGVHAVAFVAILTIGLPAAADGKLPGALQVLGTVRDAAAPVANALVIALNIQNLSATQTRTSTDGSYLLAPLQAGIYRIIAVKEGFDPAITTLASTRASHRVNLRLESGRQARSRTSRDEIWEIRGSLPPDILRELDAVMQPVQQAVLNTPRFRGEMMSLAAVDAAAPQSAQTALGVESRLGASWQLGIRGNLHRVDDPTDGRRFGEVLAESNAVAMELRGANRDAVRLASTTSSWRYSDVMPADGREADVRSHNLEWTHGNASVQVRYFAQENLFHSSPAGSNLIEIGGNAPLFQTRRGDLGVSLRVARESVRSAGDDAVRTADVAANGTFAVVPSFVLHYGMASRIGLESHDLAPRTGAEWKLTKNTSLVASGLYKVIDGDAALPMLVVASDIDRVVPRYSYSLGVVSGGDENRISAVATVTAIDTPLRMIVGDAYDQYWDGLSVDSGDIRRDLRLVYRRVFGETLALDLSASGGTATPATAAGRAKVYVSGELQSSFAPTRTSLAVSYREIEQPNTHGETYRTERVNLRMAQSLYLPIDVRVLLGLELTRAANSPFLLDALVADGGTRKYVGGLAVNF